MSTADGSKERRHRRLRHLLFYWLRVVALLVLGLKIEENLNEENYWIEQRYTVYQTLQRLSPRKAQARWTALVLIDDDDYWKGEPSGRAPIKRDYLAKLIEAVDSARPAVIALDFDLSSPSPDGNPVERPELIGETQKLCEAAQAASGHQPVVLPTSLGYINEHERVVLESDVYDGCLSAEKAAGESGGAIRKGHIGTPLDPRQVPLLSLKVEGAMKTIDSLSVAIARAVNPRLVPAPEESSEDHSVPYGGYMEVSAMNVSNARDVLAHKPEALAKLAHRAVIIGGAWSSLGYRRGPKIDANPTPLGPMPGAYIHANYAEAILDSRLYTPVEGWRLQAIEVILSLLVALAFTLRIPTIWKLFSVPLLCLGLVAFSYVCLINFGLFFDFFIPVLLVIGHGAFEQTHHLYEQAREWRADALKWRAHVEGTTGRHPSGDESPASEDSSEGLTRSKEIK
jgi:CHASE2 domain-containing sensor protein